MESESDSDIVLRARTKHGTKYLPWEFCHGSGWPVRKVNLKKVDQLLQYDKFRIIQSLTTLSAFDTPTVAEWLINQSACTCALLHRNLVLLLNASDRAFV